MSRRWRRWGTIGVSAGLLVVVVLVNVGVAARRAWAVPEYWQRQARLPVTTDALRVVAIGASDVQGVGADHPWEGYVGRIAAHLRERTGRPVHVTNVASGGATVAEMLRAQVPTVDLDAADLVIIAASSDMTSGVPLERHRADLARLLDRLPAERTVFSDLPPWPGRDPYQAVLTELTEERGIRRADLAGALRDHGFRLDLFSWLPPHFSSTGYRVWFEAYRPAVDDLIQQR